METVAGTLSVLFDPLQKYSMKLFSLLTRSLCVILLPKQGLIDTSYCTELSP
jgi:hypothetical protein